jgi:23S rRNA (uridine2552-2'-O)-methyltransferase
MQGALQYRALWDNTLPTLTATLLGFACSVSAAFALSVLKPGGHFLAKTFQGGTEGALLDQLKKSFRSVHHVKPPASRDESVELYLLARDFRG